MSSVVFLLYISSVQSIYSLGLEDLQFEQKIILAPIRNHKQPHASSQTPVLTYSVTESSKNYLSTGTTSSLVQAPPNSSSPITSTATSAKLEELRAYSKRFDIRVQSNKKKGRAGHELKDTASALIIATIFNWKYVVKNGTFEAAREIIDLDKITPYRHCKGVVLKLLGQGQKTWGAWHSFEQFVSNVREKHFALSNSWKDGEQICVRLQMNWRVHLPQVYEWESYGKLPRGTYMRVVRSLQQGFYYDPRQKWQRPGKNVVVHFRRGDTSRCCIRSKEINEVNEVQFIATLDMLDEVASRHGFENCDSCRFQLITEKDHATDVFELGCSRLQARGIHCNVSTSSLLDDFMQMVASDIFVMSSSSLSHWAALLGPHEHVYLLPGLKAPHDVWTSYLPQNPTEFSGAGFRQTCFAYENDVLHEIQCTRPAVRAINPFYNKNIFEG